MSVLRAIVLLVIAGQLAGCAPSSIPTSKPQLATASTTATVTPPHLPASETPWLSATMLPVSPTPDTRLPPEQWREWPVVPAVTGTAIEIYRRGVALGNDPHAFSKVGDCQSVKEAFMGFYDLPDRYQREDYSQNLLETIDNFAGHFNTDGEAVRGGFNAAAVLSPLWANPDVCLPGENPLECELRITKPSTVIISLEVWWYGRTPDAYAAYMQKIIDYVISRGVVPILVTKADNVEGDNSINLATTRLAYQYDIPLWNFWRAVQTLPNLGLDPNRPDGFHISTEAWNVRSFTGLETLDSIWRGLRNAEVTTIAGTPSPTATVLATDTQLAALTPVSGATLTPGTDRIIFGLSQRQGEAYDHLGVYLFDLISQKSFQIAGQGFNFQTASPDGEYILINQGEVLYRANLDGSRLVKLTDSFYHFGKTGAIWLPDDKIVVILKQGSDSTLVIMLPNGSSLTRLSLPAEGLPIELYPSPDSAKVYWDAGICTAVGICTRQGTWLTDLSSSVSQSLTGVLRPVLSPDSLTMAHIYLDAKNQSDITFALPDGSAPRQALLPEAVVMDFAWSPRSDKLAVMMAVRSNYSGRISNIRNFLVDPVTLILKEFPQTTGLNGRVLWSPDSAYLLLAGTDATETGYQISLRLLNLATEQLTDLASAVNQSSSNYLLLTNLIWLAHP